MLPAEGARVTAALGNAADLRSVFLHEVCFQSWMDNGADGGPGTPPPSTPRSALNAGDVLPGGQLRQ